MSGYYPPGTYARDPQAPFNAPCTEAADAHAIRQVCGEDASLTAETLGEFIALVDDKRFPMSTKTDHLRGPISSAELIKVMFDRRNTDAVIAAATRELATRYLDDPHTRSVIEDMAARYAMEAV